MQCINVAYANSNTQNFYVQNYYIHELMQKIRIRFVNLGKYIYISLPLSVFSVIPIRDIE